MSMETIYGMHTGQYLNFASNHLLQQKISVVHCKASLAITAKSDIIQKDDHVNTALRKC